ncbi:MAG: DUF4190 domain-containing protein [Lachnospiraceae bacterium]|nr:DUF4190 domain-containing protein [Lachnospiraceae bacterium]
MDEYNYNETYEMNSDYENWEDDDYREPQSNGLAITGMVLGIVALVFGLLFSCCGALFSILFSAPFAIGGLITSIIALKKGQNKGMAIAGIICSALALLIGVVMILIAFLSYIFLGMAYGLDSYYSY